MNGLPSSVQRVWLIARITLLEAARQRVFHLLLFLAFALVIGAQALREFNFGTSELKFTADFGFGALFLFGSILTIVATAQLFFAEIENRTALTLLAKPMRRAEFLWGKFVGIMSIVTVFCAVLTLLLIAVLYARETALLPQHPDLYAHGRALNYGEVVAAGIAQWLKFGVLAVFALLIASFAQTNFYVVMVSFAVLAICHLQPLAQQACERTESWLMRGCVGTIGVIFPNFRLFNLSDELGGGALDAALLGQIALYAALYIAAVGSLAAYSFGKREI